MAALDDKIYRMVNATVDAKLDPIEKQGNATAKTVEAISTKVDAIYGNGSGRIGILDEIKAEQKNIKLSQESHESKNASFRHEVRGYIEQQNLLQATQVQTDYIKVQDDKTFKRSLQANIKWLLSGIAFVAWELIKIKWLKR